MFLNPWGRAQTFLFSIGIVLFALLFLVLRTQNDRLVGSSVARLLGSHSLAEKYSSILSYSDSLSIALWMAMLSGIVVGLVLGLLNPMGPAIARRALRRISRIEQGAHFLLFLGIISLPFLTLGAYDASSSFDRTVAFILDNDLLASTFVGANYAMYMMICIALATTFRTFWEK